MNGHGGRKGRRLSREEHALWETVTRSVKPLRKRRPKSEPEAEIEKPAARPVRKVAPPVTVTPQPAKAPSPPPLAPLDRRTKQGIARGKREIDGRIDLHGHTQHEAHAALLRFLRASQSKGCKLVLVITGKGMSGTRGDIYREHGVLRRQVPLWLALPDFRDYVVGFDEAALAHGGEGALYVRLRKLR